MSALTRERGTYYQDAGCLSIPVAAGVIIYKGAMVAANAAGHAVPGTTALGLRYIGRAECSVNNSGGGAGTQRVEVRRLKAFKWSNDGSIFQQHLMTTAYIVDDQTVAATDGGGSRSAAGLIVGVEPDGVWVQ